MLSETMRPGIHWAKLLKVPPFEQPHGLKERPLHPNIQIEGEIDGPADMLRIFVEAQIRLSAADQLEHEIQGVDEDEVADPPAARASLDEDCELPQIAPPPGVRLLEAKPVELRPVLQQRRDHRGHPADVGMGQKTNVAPEQSAVKPLIELAQVCAGQRVVFHGHPLGKQTVPEFGPLDGVGIFALRLRIALPEGGQGRAGKGHRGENPILGPAIIQVPQPLDHVSIAWLITEHG